MRTLSIVIVAIVGICTFGIIILALIDGLKNTSSLDEMMRSAWKTIKGRKL